MMGTRLNGERKTNKKMDNVLVDFFWNYRKLTSSILKLQYWRILKTKKSSSLNFLMCLTIYTTALSNTTYFDTIKPRHWVLVKQTKLIKEIFYKTRWTTSIMFNLKISKLKFYVNWELENLNQLQLHLRPYAHSWPYIVRAMFFTLRSCVKMFGACNTFKDAGIDHDYIWVWFHNTL